MVQEIEYVEEDELELDDEEDLEDYDGLANDGSGDNEAGPSSASGSGEEDDTDGGEGPFRQQHVRGKAVPQNPSGACRGNDCICGCFMQGSDAWHLQ